MNDPIGTEEEPASGAGTDADDLGPRDCHPLGVDLSSVHPTPTSETRTAAMAVHGFGLDVILLIN